MTKTTGNPGKKVAMITGGASGLGFAAAKRLLRDGACVALADIKKDQLEKAAASLAMPEDRVRTYVLDVTDPVQVQQVTAQINADFGQIDVLLTSAGISYQGTVLDNSLEAWNRVVGINLTGTYLCVQAAAKFMVERRKGRIVMIASITGQQVWSGRVAYAASKGGVMALAKSCAIDLAQYGITVNSVSPGPIRTPQTASLHSKIIQDAIVNATPMARYGEADEVADVIAFLASDDSRFVTAHDLVVDGGLTSAAILYDLKLNPIRN